MQSKKVADNKYLLRLERGEEINQTIKIFCEQSGIKAGYFLGIGALSSAVLVSYDLNKKEYLQQEINEPCEIAQMFGDISTFENDLVLHTHATLGTLPPAIRTMAGHLKQGVVSATCEVVLTAWEGEIKRYADSEIGLNLLDL